MGGSSLKRAITRWSFSLVAFIGRINSARIFKLEFHDGTSLKITEGHPIIGLYEKIKCINPDSQPDLIKLLNLEKLEIGDELIGVRIVTCITKLKKQETVYNLILEDDHTFYANDILVLQNRNASLAHLRFL